MSRYPDEGEIPYPIAERDPVDRRTFLQGALVAGVGAIAPDFVLDAMTAVT